MLCLAGFHGVSARLLFVLIPACYSAVMPDIYVACAMSSLPPEEYEVLRTSVLAVCDALREKGWRPYSEPYELTEDTFEALATAFKKNFAVLDAARAFLLIYTYKGATSALIELGYALHRKIPIIILAQEGVKLPYYLQDADVNATHNIRVIPFSTYEELPELSREV